MNDDQAALVEQLTKKFVDEGRLIEAGWQSMRIIVLPPNVSDVQVDEMRKAFFAGAQHLFGSILSVLDSDGDGEPTPADLNRMELIHNELHDFERQLRAQVGLG